MFLQRFVISITWYLLVFQCVHVFSEEENFLLINGTTGEVVVEIGSHLNERVSPCSTFKMALSLMGYDAGILQDEKTPIWDFQEGHDDFLTAWRGPQTPQSWMQYSCVWYAKTIALLLGLEKVQNYLAAFEYGNQDMSGGLAKPGPASPAWISSSLKISPREQVAFIQSMLQEKLPLSSHALIMTKKILFKEDLPNGWQLFGKVVQRGSTIRSDGTILNFGWFVGWIEKDHNLFPFAYLIRGETINSEPRAARVKQLLPQIL